MSTENTKASPDPNPVPALIVFGKDEAGKAHASWFNAIDAALAERAAGFMRMRVLAIATDEQRTIALQLPQGRVFASGKGFVPFVKMALYERLTAFEGSFEPAAPIEAELEPLGFQPPEHRQFLGDADAPRPHQPEAGNGAGRSR